MAQPGLDTAAFSFMLYAVLASLTLEPERGVEDLKTEREAATAMLAALQPRDAVEAALAARAVATHHASMACFRRAVAVGLSDQMMSRLFATGTALSRMSMQLVRAIDARKRAAPGARAAATAPNPVEAMSAIQCAHQPMPSEPSPGSPNGPAMATDLRTRHPVPSETRPAAAAAGKPPAKPAARPAAAGLGPAAAPADPIEAAWAMLGVHHPMPSETAPGRTAADRSQPAATRPAATGAHTPHAATGAGIPAQAAAAPDALPPVMTREQLAPFATLALAMIDAA
jgi:hypothetical protein